MLEPALQGGVEQLPRFVCLAEVQQHLAEVALDEYGEERVVEMRQQRMGFARMRERSAQRGRRVGRHVAASQHVIGADANGAQVVERHELRKRVAHFSGDQERVVHQAFSLPRVAHAFEAGAQGGERQGQQALVAEFVGDGAGAVGAVQGGFEAADLAAGQRHPAQQVGLQRAPFGVAEQADHLFAEINQGLECAHPIVEKTQQVTGFATFLGGAGVRCQRPGTFSECAAFVERRRVSRRARLAQQVCD